MDHTNHVPKKEWMAYCVGALGQGMVYAIMSSYISDFYISVLKLTPLFVLLLMLLARRKSHHVTATVSATISVASGTIG